MDIQFDKTKIEKTLEETSLDDAGTTNLVHDMYMVDDFDEVSKQMAEQIRLGNKPRSCDALYVGEQYNYLIEFKNKKSSDLKGCKPELHEKAYDSLFQLMVYLNWTDGLEDLIKRTRLILVYNDAKGTEDPKKDISSSESVDKLVTKMKAFAKVTDLDSYPKKFKLGELQGKLYDKVVTVDVKVFDKDIKPIIFGV